MRTAITIFAVAVAASAQAEPLKTTPAALDPTKAYVLVEYRQTPNSWGRFPGSKKYLPLMTGLMLARYDSLRGEIRGRGAATDNPVLAGQPTVESFRNRAIAQGEGRRLMLLAVEPDTWVVQGWGDTSFSLGSYSFVLAAGTVTDLGIVTAATDWAPGEQPKLTAGRLAKIMIAGPFMKTKVAPVRATFRTRGVEDLAVPPSLQAVTRPVVFTSGARFGNYLGGLVNRIEGMNAGATTQP